MIDACSIAEVWEDVPLPILMMEQLEGGSREIYRNRPAKQLLGDKTMVSALIGYKGEKLSRFFEVHTQKKLEVFGRERDTVFSVVPMQWHGYLVCILHDVTGQYLLNQELVEQAQSANQAKTRFLSEMSHDIRTPMNAIVGMTGIAMTQEGVPAGVRQCLEKIRMASMHLMSLLNEVLDISRIESGRLEIHKEALNVGDMVHELLLVVGPQVEAKKLEFHFEAGTLACENILADGVRIKQIILNLLSNAVKYTPEGGRVELGLAIEQQSSGQMQLRMYVRDTGIGISPEFLDRMFLPFEREEDAIAHRIPGAGLGMAIIGKIVDKMGGKIRVESEKGHDTCFTVEIPVETADPDIKNFASALGGKRVLLLTTDERMVKLVRTKLEGIGVALDHTSSCEEALAMLDARKQREEAYFALVTEEQVSDEEIFEFLPKVCTVMDADFPVLMLTESDWSETEYMYTRSGVSEFVPLPLFGSRLYGALYQYADAEHEKKRREDAEEVYDFSGYHLMLVEDNELNREIAMTLLEDTYATITPVENGAQAVELFRDSQVGEYDLILMDIQMPVLNGLDATRQIRKLKRIDAKSVPIIAMTANAFVEDMQNSLDAGMNAHISKPIDMKRVLSCLNRFLGGRNNERISEAIYQEFGAN